MKIKFNPKLVKSKLSRRGSCVVTSNTVATTIIQRIC